MATGTAASQQAPAGLRRDAIGLREVLGDGHARQGEGRDLRRRGGVRDEGLDPLDAYQLVTQAVESPLANVCDTNYTSIAKMPKRYLPTAAFGGVHDQLRELATSL